MNSSETSSPGSTRTTRKNLILIAAGILGLSVILYAIWWKLVLSHYQSTDDAYVHGNLIQITPRIAGTVISIEADDTDAVMLGTPLVRLDPTDTDIALQQAKANLAQTVRQVHTLFAQNDVLRAEITVRQAGIEQAKATLTRARSDLARRQTVAKSGAVSGEDILHAKTALKAAESAFAQAHASLVAAQANQRVNQALTQNTTPKDHPDIQKASAAVRNAWLAHTRTVLRAPVTGVIARRSVQIGQHINPANVLMNVVPLDQIWVEANFKEGQLRAIQVGQRATLTADLYGDSVTYHGRVAGLGTGTGSAFALLPAQNATGNWIKVVQRVPVRIALDPHEIAKHPLRIGLSMNVEVDVRPPSATGKQTALPSRLPLTTDALTPAQDEVDTLIQKIIQTNFVSSISSITRA